MSVIDLPEIVLLKIVQYLNAEDIDSCFHVCQVWKNTLNSKKIWRACCRGIPEEYLKNLLLNYNKTNRESDFDGTSIWRLYCKQVLTVYKNWREGHYMVEKTEISPSDITFFHHFMDGNGNRWLFSSKGEEIVVWNFAQTLVLNNKIKAYNYFGISIMKGRLMTGQSNYIQIYDFKFPNYDLKLQYRFAFTSDRIMTPEEGVPDYMSGARYFVVDNFFVGYVDHVTNIHTAFLHIWDLDTGIKIGKCSTFQQSFVNFILSKTGRDITNAFEGGLLAFPGNSGRILINVIDDSCKKCQISLYNLHELKIVNVVAIVENSHTAWCFMEGDIVAIYHLAAENTSQISVYNVSGTFLHSLVFPESYNPAWTHEFLFKSSRIILKVRKTLHILTITDSSQLNVTKIDIGEADYIMTYYDPKFLLLFEKSNSYAWNSEGYVSVWDADLGTKLWVLGNLSYFSCYEGLLKNITFPSKLVVQFAGDGHFSILNFMTNKKEAVETQKQSTLQH